MDMDMSIDVDIRVLVRYWMDTAYLLTEVPTPPKTPDHMLFSPRASFSLRGASVRHEQPVIVEELHGKEQ